MTIHCPDDSPEGASMAPWFLIKDVYYYCDSIIRRNTLFEKAAIHCGNYNIKCKYDLPHLIITIIIIYHDLLPTPRRGIIVLLLFV